MGKRTRTILVTVLLLVGLGWFVAWYKLLRSVDQPAWIAATSRDEFLYGSVGGEKEAGIPYWIWLALPRIFPEYMPGPGGYASLGFSWEETREMPAGFAKKRVGYIRVTGNCALCHTYSISNGPDAAPTVVAVGPGHTAEATRLLTFYKQCAEDPRFNAANILDEAGMATKLSFVDKMLYRFVLIPETRKRMLAQDRVIVDEALWQHSRNPKAEPGYRRQMQTLRTGPETADRGEVLKYLDTIP